MNSLTHHWDFDKPVDQVRRDMRSNLPPRLSGWKYQLKAQDDTSMAFDRTYAPGWTIVLGVLFFPIGLLFLLFRQHASLVFTVEPEGEATKVTVNGLVNGQLRDSLVNRYPPDAPRPASERR